MKLLFTVLLIILLSNLRAECNDLNYSECDQYSEYCEWNEQTEECQDIGGGGGSQYYGQYEFSSISQSDGMRNSSYYNDTELFYPIDAPLPLKSIVLGPGWGGNGSSISSWAQLFASYGFIAATLDYNDAENDSHYQRGEAMLDLIETIKQENYRITSPVYNKVDTLKFAAGGYSISGGSAINAGLLDSMQVLDAIISFNPTVIFEDCDVCAEIDSEYCICLVPELLEQQVVPALIISGENEALELPSYEGMLGIDVYNNHPQFTNKMLYEIQNGGHGSAAFPSNEMVINKTLNWLKYHLMDSLQVCGQLLELPDDASVFSTTLECMIDSVESCILGDVYVSEGHTSGDPEDYIELYNSGDEDCSLKGFQLDDSEELDDLTFGDVIIPAGGYWLGYEDADSSFSSGLSGSGDLIVFADSTGSSLIVELNQTEEMDGISLSQSFDADGNGCYTSPTPGLMNGECVTLSLGHNSSIPVDYSLSQNYPNPFNPLTRIAYSLPKESVVSVYIYDVKGFKVKSLVNKNMSAGNHSFVWDSTNDRGDIVSTGIYFFTLQTSEFTSTRKMLFLK
jgi:hypothetical protein